MLPNNRWGAFFILNIDGYQILAILIMSAKTPAAVTLAPAP